MNIDLNDISKKIIEQLNLLEEISKKDANSLFDIICEFQLGTDQIQLDEQLDGLKKNDIGIYLFEVKRNVTQKYEEWIDNFTKRFRGYETDEKFFLHKFTPNIINKRMNRHIESKDEWIPLYLGKSMDIKTRVLVHIFSELGKPPFALKLNNRLKVDNSHIFADEIFRLKVIRLENLHPNTYNSIASFLEKILREKVAPIVGKQ